MSAFDEFRGKIARDVREHGRSVVGVFPDAASPPPNGAFAYTIGNSDRGLPELLVVGMFDRDAMWLLNRLSEKMVARGGPFASGEMVDLGGRRAVCVVDAADEVKDLYTFQATAWRGGPDYRVQQVVVPDPEGRFPWDDGCGEPYRSVAVRRAASGRPH